MSQPPPPDFDADPVKPTPADLETLRRRLDPHYGSIAGPDPDAAVLRRAVDTYIRRRLDRSMEAEELFDLDDLAEAAGVRTASRRLRRGRVETV